ncbi:CWF19-like protein 2 homolog [Anthonomus grandis grandis]|uniref:CWF19-like protein 2 homolog n=1 Tax=Anthonomus grandis grandis TaxID=2921223 RepID=UPI00216603BE|nr:CWF19-like protein 2 homolog [Anthonomus grandis grandis]
MGKHKKKSKKHKRHHSSSSSDEWVEADQIKEKSRASSPSGKSEHRKHKRASKERSPSSPKDVDTPKKPKIQDKDDDSWLNFATYSNEERKKQREDAKKDEKEKQQYDPRNCPRELNPYWKDGGDGLPKFRKPKDDDSDDGAYSYKRQKPHTSSSSGWRKPIKSDSKLTQSDSTHPPDSSYNTPDSSQMTEKELNLLAGKLVKAEIMGNEKLVQELKAKLEKGREALATSKTNEEGVILTQTDRQGHSKPLTLQHNYDDGFAHRKERKKASNTHDNNERVRYFADDDKYSLRDMFESEKLSTTDDQDREFMKIASTVRKNDDMDDFFADSARRTKSDRKSDQSKHAKAVNDHKKLSGTLDNCSRCIQSDVMPKHLIVDMKDYVYLGLPPHEPLTEGHCLIVPIRHAQSVTQLDENEWSEMKDVRRQLVRLFEARAEDVVFFEVAAGFHRYPHMVLECVPLPKSEAELAPIYFKKAIDESETEWAQNKKLVSLKGRDVRRAIPKGLPYFSVSFGMEEGFAHVIEDERMFPANFAQEIIGGMLDLHHSKWRKPAREKFDVQSKRVLEFSRRWNDSK